MGFVSDEKPTATTEADTPSPWLRTWIEFQVDARVNQAVRDLIDGELTKVTSLEELRGSADRVQEEVRAVAENQAKLLQVVEGISSEISEAGEHCTRNQQELADLARGVQQLESKFSVWRTEVAAEVRASAMRDKGDSESLRLEAQAAASARTDFEERLEGLRLEVLSATRSWTDFERRLEHGHRLLADRLDNNHRKLAERTESWMEGMGQDLHARENRLTSEMRQGLRKEALAEIRSELRLEVGTDLGGRIHRQQEAVRALEEQLFLLDKRLGARIDDVLQSQFAIEHSAVRERAEAAIAKDDQKRSSAKCGTRSAASFLGPPERKAAAGMLAAAELALQEAELDAQVMGKGAVQDTASEASTLGAGGPYRSRSAGRSRGGVAWRGRLALSAESQTSAAAPGEVENLPTLRPGSAEFCLSDVPTKASFLALESLATSLQDQSTA